MRSIWGTLVIFAALSGCATKPDAESRSVVIYVHKEAGIHVKAVFDKEESESIGAMNRLPAEKSNPQGDAHWANEPVWADVLRQLWISTPLRPTNGQRSRSRSKTHRSTDWVFSSRAAAGRQSRRQDEAHRRDCEPVVWHDNRAGGRPVFVGRGEE